MSIDFVRRGWMLFVTTPSAVLLSVWIGVLGCLCPISCSSCWMDTAWDALMYNPANSALAALNMTDLMMLEVLMIAPLLGGFLTSDDMKKCPPVLLQAPDSLKYDALLCIASTMSLFSYVRMTSG